MRNKAWHVACIVIEARLLLTNRISLCAFARIYICGWAVPSVQSLKLNPAVPALVWPLPRPSAFVLQSTRGTTAQITVHFGILGVVKPAPVAPVMFHHP